LDTDFQKTGFQAIKQHWFRLVRPSKLFGPFLQLLPLALRIMAGY
jgi:hypothetical protein